MGGNPTQQTNQQSQSQPWAPALPAVQGLLGQLQGVSTGVSPNQSNAANSLFGAASGLPNFGGAAGGVAGNLFGGGGANNQAGLVGNAYGNLQSSLSPLTNPGNLNPFNTPGFADAYRTMGSDITNNINDHFAAAGRDLSPGNTTALARGLAQGQGGLIANQYNANAGNLMGASNSLFGAGLGAGNALTGYNQMGVQNMLGGIGAAGAIPGLSLAGPQAALSAANTMQNLPLSNLGGYESLLTPLAQLGTQASGTRTQETQIPLWQQILGGAAGAGSLFSAPAGGTSAASGLASAGSTGLSSLMSLLAL